VGRDGTLQLPGRAHRPVPARVRWPGRNARAWRISCTSRSADPRAPCHTGPGRAAPGAAGELCWKPARPRAYTIGGRDPRWFRPYSRSGEAGCRGRPSRFWGRPACLALLAGLAAPAPGRCWWPGPGRPGQVPGWRLCSRSTAWCRCSPPRRSIEIAPLRHRPATRPRCGGGPGGAGLAGPVPTTPGSWPHSFGGQQQRGGGRRACHGARRADSRMRPDRRADSASRSWVPQPDAESRGGRSRWPGHSRPEVHSAVDRVVISPTCRPDSVGAPGWLLDDP